MQNNREKRKIWKYVVVAVFILILGITAIANEPIEKEIETKAAETAEIKKAEIVPVKIPKRVVVVETESVETLSESEEETEPSSEYEETESESVPEETTEAETTEESHTKLELSKEEQDILLKIVEAEATGQPVEGKMYVAAVIINRMQDSEFPDTIKGVVYQKQQFSPVTDGRINCKPTKDTVEAVNRVLKGETDAQGATFFMNPKTASKKNVKWFKNHLTYLFSYKGHEFYR